MILQTDAGWVGRSAEATRRRPRAFVWLLLCALAVIGPMYSQGKPHPQASQQTRQTPTIQQVHDFIAARDDEDCRAENQSLERDLAAASAYFIFGIGVGIGSALCLLVFIQVYRKRFVPRTARGKQASVLIPTALWCSFCILGVANDPEFAQRPLSAVVNALLWSGPALLFGGIGIWWFSPHRSAQDVI